MSKKKLVNQIRVWNGQIIYQDVFEKKSLLTSGIEMKGSERIKMLISIKLLIRYV